MLLRQVTKHVKAQNWFAVGIDFTIVVVGVYIGIQVSNWNDEIRVQSLEESYLSRLADELRSNIIEFEADKVFAQESRSVLQDFIAVVDGPSPSADDLVHHASNYLTTGVFFAQFKPSQATFDELKSTGNLDIIQDKEIREALIKLHALYQNGIKSVDNNEDWVFQTEDTVYLEFDALRFDARTSALFSERSTAEAAQQILDNQDLLLRHAALHFWLKDRAIEIIAGAAEQSQTVLQMIESKN